MASAVGSDAADQFDFSRLETNAGSVDSIENFDAAFDKIGLSGTKTQDFADLIKGGDVQMSQDGADTVLNLGNDHEIRLVGQDVAELDASNFVF